MEKLLKIINYLTPACDKTGHYYWGDIYAMLGFILYFILPNPLIILTFSLPAAIGKEIRDRVSGKGNPEFMDFIYTIIPSIRLIIILYLLK